MRQILLLVFLTGTTLFSAPALTQSSQQAAAPDQLLIRFAPASSASERAAARQQISAYATKSLKLVDGLEVVQTRLTASRAAAALSSNPNVLYVEPDYFQYPVELPDDTYADLLWGLHNTGQEIRGVIGTDDADIDAPEAWAGVASPQTIVAIIDSGTQLDHEDLAANIWVNKAESDGSNGVDDNVPANGFIDDVHGWDFFSDDPDPSDEDGHGTHTAGTVGAVPGNSLGIAGVCGSCRLMILRFLGPDGGTTSDAIASLQYAVANGATVSNNSWGGGPYSQALYDAIKAAGDAGHIFVAAAGNSYNNNDVSPAYPASYDLENIIAVAATGNRDDLASFSNYGGASVDLGAPGIDIASSYWDPVTPTDDYWYSSGTSMAAPHVAGVVALVQAAEAQENSPACVDPVTLAEVGVVERVLRSARPVEQLAPFVATGGIVNAADAVNCSLNLPWPLPTPPPLPMPPAMPPDNLQAVDSGQGSYLLSWTSVADASYYLIEREQRRKNGRRTSGTYFSVSALPGPGGEDLSHEDVTETTENVYYRIAAGNAAGNTVMSEWVLAQSGGASDPEPPDDGGDGSGKCHPRRGCN
jgi:subtilisin family serine protease